MRTLELRVPPVATAALFALGMWLLARAVPGWAVPGWAFPLPARILVAVALALAGLGCVLAAGRTFRSARTTVNPTTPAAATTLVRDGIYRFSRNPMYVALLALLLALAVLLAHPLPGLLLPAFVAYLNRFQILPEEQALQARFGADYAAYRASVRRWL